MERKKKIAAALAAFLCFMAVCTIIAKGIYKAGLARVTVCSPEEQSVAHRITAAGSGAAGESLGIYTEADLRVYTVFVQTGDRVAAGTPLFCVDLTDLAEQILNAQAECDYLKAQLDDLAGEKKEQDQEKKKEAARLLEEYERLVQEQDLLIGDAQLNADIAWIRMQEEPSETVVEESVSGSDIADDPAVPWSDRETLQAEYQKAQNTVEQAKLDKEKALSDWQHRLEDAKEGDLVQLAQIVRLKGELERGQRRIEKLTALKEREGNVCAEEDSFILGSFVQAGERTLDRACMLYSPAESESVIEILVDEEQAAFLSIGDTVKLKYRSAWGEQADSGTITYMEKAEGGRLLRIIPEGSRPSPGQTVHMEAASKSEPYPAVVPISALYGGAESGYFVYVVESFDGILGKEERVSRIPVSVLEWGDNGVAVSGAAITRDSLVVMGSSKELQPDDVVRVIEKSRH